MSESPSFLQWVVCKTRTSAGTTVPENDDNINTINSGCNRTADMTKTLLLLCVKHLSAKRIMCQNHVS